MQTVYHRYSHDPVFARLVDLIGSILEGQEGLLFTPSELREAVLLASMMYEQRHIRPLLINKELGIIDLPFTVPGEPPLDKR